MQSQNESFFCLVCCAFSGGVIDGEDEHILCESGHWLEGEPLSLQKTHLMVKVNWLNMWIVTCFKADVVVFNGFYFKWIKQIVRKTIPHDNWERFTDPSPMEPLCFKDGPLQAAAI